MTVRPREYELAEALPAGLVAAVQESIGTGYHFESLAVAYDELGVQLNVQVVGKAPAPQEMATAVRTLISDYYAQPVRVRLLTRIALGFAAENDYHARHSARALTAAVGMRRTSDFQRENECQRDTRRMRLADSTPSLDA